MITATQLKPSKTPVSLPTPNGEFCHMTEYLTEVEGNGLKRVRALMATKVASVITNGRACDSFPLELVTGNNHGP